GKLDFDKLHGMSDEEVIATLTDIKGIGEWTAHMFLIFALRRPNILATGDLGVRTAVQRAYRKRKLPTPAQMEKIAECWQPYRSVVCCFLGRSLKFKPEISDTKKQSDGKKRVATPANSEKVPN